MAYSPDPKIRAQGEQIIRLHRDFIKMREQNAFAAGEAEKQRKHAFAIEDVRNRNATARQRQLAEIKARAGAGDEKLTTDQLRAKYIQLAQQAQAAGDFEAAAMFQDNVRYITSLRASERPDPMAGKPDVGAIANLPTVPPRAPVQPPTGGPVSNLLYPEGQPNPVANRQPAGLPAGAKQIGTAKGTGKPVYELNGKRFTLE